MICKVINQNNKDRNRNNLHKLQEYQTIIDKIIEEYKTHMLEQKILQILIPTKIYIKVNILKFKLYNLVQYN